MFQRAPKANQHVKGRRFGFGGPLNPNCWSGARIAGSGLQSLGVFGGSRDSGTSGLAPGRVGFRV